MSTHVQTDAVAARVDLHPAASLWITQRPTSPQSASRRDPTTALTHHEPSPAVQLPESFCSFVFFLWMHGHGALHILSFALEQVAEGRVSGEAMVEVAPVNSGAELLFDGRRQWARDI
jgi:hypothetical protein